MLYHSSACPTCGLPSCMHRRPAALQLQVEVNIPFQAKSIDVEITRGTPVVKGKPVRRLYGIEPREVCINYTPQNGLSKHWRLGPGSLWGMTHDTDVYAYFAEATLELKQFSLYLELGTVRMSGKFTDWLEGQFVALPQVNQSAPQSWRCFIGSQQTQRESKQSQHDLEFLGCWVTNADYIRRLDVGAAASQLKLVMNQAKIFRLNGQEEILP